MYIYIYKLKNFRKKHVYILNNGGLLDTSFVSLRILLSNIYALNLKTIKLLIHTSIYCKVNPNYFHRINTILLVLSLSLIVFVVEALCMMSIFSYVKLIFKK